jgi:hypothetical protein
MNGHDQIRTGPDAKSAASGALRRTMVIWFIFAAVSALVLVSGLLLPARDLQGLTPSYAARMRGIFRIFLAMLFVAAAITCVGIQWAATILAARRYKARGLDAAVSALSVSQWVCFAVYVLFEAAALYHRLGFAGGWLEFIMAVASAAFAVYYFLRLPSFLLRRLSDAAQKDGGAPGAPP